MPTTAAIPNRSTIPCLVLRDVLLRCARVDSARRLLLDNKTCRGEDRIFKSLLSHKRERPSLDDSRSRLVYS